MEIPGRSPIRPASFRISSSATQKKNIKQKFWLKKYKFNKNEEVLLKIIEKKNSQFWLKNDKI